jgi:hypothetical protein
MGKTKKHLEQIVLKKRQGRNELPKVDSKKVFKYSEGWEERKRPDIGCLIVVVGSILVWGSIFWLLRII